jgi:hypothetical protein
VSRPLDADGFDGEIFLAGERVPTGRYRMIGTSREITIDGEDYLPASFDGRVACYKRVTETWNQVGEQSGARSER